MATVDRTSGTVKTNINGLVTAINIVDYALLNGAANDVDQVIKVPLGATVIACGSVVITAEGATATATLGDGVDPNGYDASVNFNATAGTATRMLEATDAYAGARYYTAADTIDYVLGHAMDAAKILTWAQWVQYDNENQLA